MKIRGLQKNQITIIDRVKCAIDMAQAKHDDHIESLGGLDQTTLPSCVLDITASEQSGVSSLVDMGLGAVGHSRASIGWGTSFEEDAAFEAQGLYKAGDEEPAKEESTTPGANNAARENLWDMFVTPIADWGVLRE